MNRNERAERVRAALVRCFLNARARGAVDFRDVDLDDLVERCVYSLLGPLALAELELGESHGSRRTGGGVSW